MYKRQLHGIISRHKGRVIGLPRGPGGRGRIQDFREDPEDEERIQDFREDPENEEMIQDFMTRQDSQHRKYEITLLAEETN